MDKHMSIKLNRKIYWAQLILILLVAFFSQEIIADGSVTLVTTPNIGSVAASVNSSFTSLTKFITAGSYLGGLAFFIGAIMKFKQHKDNPTQTPIGTPIALVFIAGALIFLPSVLGIVGSTMFGSSGGEVAGPKGMFFE